MKLERFAYQPGSAVEFFEEALTYFGAMCERTWHDRLEVLAEQKPAEILKPGARDYAGSLHFVETNAPGIRDADQEIFVGCPITFRLAEGIIDRQLELERVALADRSSGSQPDMSVAEKTWRQQFSGTTRWKMVSGWRRSHHFSLVTLVRFEVQALDQFWSLHRLALSLPDGQMNETLAEGLTFAEVDSSGGPIEWLDVQKLDIRPILLGAMENSLSKELQEIRAGHERRLKRELDRVDSYFLQYQAELRERARGKTQKLKLEDRLEASRQEHAKRRADQVALHQIRVIPHIDAMLLVADPAWEAMIEEVRQYQTLQKQALFVPRSRSWTIKV